jgi:uncharacterized protein with HEPN domain/predicted nucleotidyltransferase
VRLLRAHLPELVLRYGINSLGVFGSYVRGQARPRSDLDLLVEYTEIYPKTPRPDLKKELTDLLGVKIDLVPLHYLKPYIGRHIHSEVIWLLRNGQETNAKIPRYRANGGKTGKMSTSKREYLDYLNDILINMELAAKFAIGFSNWRDVYDDPRTAMALTKAIENIGEAVKKIPADAKKKYPQVPWQDIAGMRDKLAHSYFDIDYEKLWQVVTEDIPRDKPFVQELVDHELRKRVEQDAQDKKPAK